MLEVVITIADELDVHPEQPVNIPTMTETKTLGTVWDLAKELETHTEDKLTEFKNKSNAEMECCEERREGYQCSERQRIKAPKDKYLKGFQIDTLFGYMEMMVHNVWAGIIRRYKKYSMRRISTRE